MFHRLSLTLLSIIGVSLLIACSGGGDGDGDGGNLPPPPPPPPSAPTITSVDPSPVNGSDFDQMIRVKGMGFINNPTVVFNSSEITNLRVPAEKVTYLSSTELNVAVTTTTLMDSWTVKVVNPDEQSSNIFAFDVVSPRTYANTYPYNTASVGDVDPWGFNVRTAMSYVAWRINQAAASDSAPYFFSNTMNGGIWGEADHWDDNIAVMQTVSMNYHVDDIPSPGAIAQWNAADLSTTATSGHVAYVEKVNDDGSVDISEYNRKGDHKFSFRLGIRPTRFIHTPLVVFDGEFNGWTSFYYLNDNPYVASPGPGISTGNAYHVAVGGHPGAYLGTTHTIYYGDTIWTGAIKSTYTYDPVTMGEIKSLAVSMDMTMMSLGETAWQLVIEQGGIRYYSVPFGAFSGSWSTGRSVDLTASKFDTNPWAGNAGILPDGNTPNLSRTGKSLKFGVVVGNRYDVPGSSTAIHGIDNFALTINR